MRIKKVIAGATAAAAGLAGGVALAAPAQAQDPGSLADVLEVDRNTPGSGPYDRNWYDFDLVREAVEVVLVNKPDSAVGVLADGSVALTAFIPNDRAFQVLEYSLTGDWEWNEKDVFDGVVTAADGLGAQLGGLSAVDVVETILLYHVSSELGAVDSAAVLSLKGASAEKRTLTMANGGEVTLQIFSANPRFPFVALRDADPNALNPTLVKSKLDIRAGEQIAHGISFVLRPLDLPRG